VLVERACQWYQRRTGECDAAEENNEAKLLQAENMQEVRAL
jgi:hypothetical protein